MKEYSTPKYWKSEYTCEHCGVLTQQDKITLNPTIYKSNFKASDLDKEFKKDKYLDKVLTMKSKIPSYNTAIDEYIYVTRCKKCKEIMVWKVLKDSISGGEKITTEGEILYPKCKYHIEPNEDMPDELKKIYDEARTIFGDSPKAAGALLRSVLEALVKKQFPQHKDEKLGSIFYKDDVKDVIPDDLLDLLKQLKNIGNDASHPSLLIYEDEDKNNVECLFGAINFFVEIFDSKTKTLNILKNTLQQNQKNKK